MSTIDLEKTPNCGCAEGKACTCGDNCRCENCACTAADAAPGCCGSQRA